MNGSNYRTPLRTERMRLTMNTAKMQGVLTETETDEEDEDDDDEDGGGSGGGNIAEESPPQQSLVV